MYKSTWMFTNLNYVKLHRLQTFPFRIQNFQVETFQKFISTLIVSKAYIDGQWVDAISGKKIKVKNPADNKLIACVPDMDEEEAEIAICAAKVAFSKAWGGINFNSRYMMLRSWTRLIRSNSEKLAVLLTTETGKPIVECKGEIAYSLNALESYARDSIYLNKDVMVGDGSLGVFVIRQPVGVVALMTSWDFPMALFARKVGAALACGCTVVCKPCADAPLTILAVTKLADKIGFPPGVINVVTTKRPVDLGTIFCTNPDVAAVSFAGSSKTCREIYRRHASTMKRFILEMYTDATFVAFQTANIEMAVNGAVASKFSNSGQMKISASRFLVHSSIYYKFIDQLKNKIQQLPVGNGLKPYVKIGPMINDLYLRKTIRLIKDAREQNAHIACGGHTCPEIGKLFFAPTIVADVNPNMMLYTDEVFGPVASVISFSNEEELLVHIKALFNPPAAVLYSNDFKEVFRVASKLNTIVIGVNQNIITAADVPFTGTMKTSERLVLGLSEFLVRKYISIGNIFIPKKRKKKTEKKLKQK